MSKIIYQIEKLRTINKQNKLVMFVGNGVSRNSDSPSWFEIIKRMAKVIGHDNCHKCEKCKSCSDKNKKGVKCKYKFSNDDFLKIPQYFYDKDPNKYKNFLNKMFKKMKGPNLIDELIIRIAPEHIITTNYDHLIEDVEYSYYRYKTIKSDRDMLGDKKDKKNNTHEEFFDPQARHYIIKMHGDLDDLNNIVLKEEDYIEYSRTHEIIEMYIKSLLFDHTFLFIGYSFNDNNLKLIMGYIDHYIKKYDIERKNKHYLVLSEAPKKEYELKYWEKKGIDIIDLSELNENIIKECKCEEIEKDIGKRLYAFLSCLKDNRFLYLDDQAEITELLEKQLEYHVKKLSVFNMISSEMLIKILRLCGMRIRLERDICWCEEIYFIPLKNVLERNALVKRYFAKTEILYICSISDNDSSKKNNESYTLSCHKEETNDKLFDLSIRNKYKELIDEIKDRPNSLEKAYYYSLVYGISKRKEIEEIMKDAVKKLQKYGYRNLLTNKDRFNLIIFELNCYLMRLKGHEYAKLEEIVDYELTKNPSFEYIKNFYKGADKIINELNEYFYKQEQDCTSKSIAIARCDSSPSTDYIWYYYLAYSRPIAHDYYRFYKKNHIMFDTCFGFTNGCIRKVINPYIKSILCLYCPRAWANKKLKHYKLQLIDIDMIIKHVKYEDFDSWLKQYKVSELEIENDIDIAELFCDFCKSTIEFKTWFLDVQRTKVFIKVMCFVHLSIKQIESISASLVLLLKELSIHFQTITDTYSPILESVHEFINRYYGMISDKKKTELLETLTHIKLDKDVYKSCIDLLHKLINKLSDCADENVYKICVDNINNSKDMKDKYFYVYHHLLYDYDKDKWHNWVNWLENNLESHDINHIIMYLIDRTLTWDVLYKNLIATKFREIESLFPAFGRAVRNIIIAHLNDRIRNLEDIDFLKKYTKEFRYIDFLFSPETFDYSKIDISINNNFVFWSINSNHMWCKLIKSKQYGAKILAHKSEFWTEENKSMLKNGSYDEFAVEIINKYLCDDNN